MKISQPVHKLTTKSINSQKRSLKSNGNRLHTQMGRVLQGHYQPGIYKTATVYTFIKVRKIFPNQRIEIPANTELNVMPDEKIIFSMPNRKYLVFDLQTKERNNLLKDTGAEGLDLAQLIVEQGASTNMSAVPEFNRTTDRLAEMKLLAKIPLPSTNTLVLN